MTQVSLLEGKAQHRIYAPLFTTCCSLPINIEHHELGQLLSNHLAAHAQVKYVKVVRDTRGGACAFVQCEVGFRTI